VVCSPSLLRLPPPRSSLSSHADFKPFVRKLSHKLQDIGVSNRVDDSGASIGKRYSRNDELGTPLGITIDVSLCYHCSESLSALLYSAMDRWKTVCTPTSRLTFDSSNPSKTTPSHCETETRQNRCAAGWMRFALPSPA
jgi:hypothetical protein